MLVFFEIFNVIRLSFSLEVILKKLEGQIIEKRKSYRFKSHIEVICISNSKNRSVKYENQNLSNYQGPNYFIYQTPVL